MLGPCPQDDSPNLTGVISNNQIPVNCRNIRGEGSGGVRVGLYEAKEQYTIVNYLTCMYTVPRGGGGTGVNEKVWSLSRSLG